MGDPLQEVLEEGWKSRSRNSGNGKAFQKLKRSRFEFRFLHFQISRACTAPSLSPGAAPSWTTSDGRLPSPWGGAGWA